MDQDTIYELMKKFDESHLAELVLESEGFKITMKKADLSSSAISPTRPLPESISVAQEAIAEKSEDGSSAGTEIITSPIIGSFYRSPAPDAPPFVSESTSVAAGDAICIIEAMKIMNKVEADFDCEIVKILAENGQLVEFNDPLFEVRRT